MVVPGYTFTTYHNNTINADYVYINYDISTIATTSATDIKITDSDETLINHAVITGTSGLAKLRPTPDDTTAIVATDLLRINFTTTGGLAGAVGDQFYVDIISFTNETGTTSSTDRINNAVYRLFAKETDNNTGIFTGTVEFVMLNQLNSDTHTVFSNTVTADRNLRIIVHEDMTDEDAPRINYLDLGGDGISTQIGDQVEAPTHSGVVSTDMETYKIGDTVNVTLEDQDLNADSDLIDVYITTADDTVGNNGIDNVLSVTFDDMIWVDTGDATCICSGVTEISWDLEVSSKDTRIS